MSQHPPGGPLDRGFGQPPPHGGPDGQPPSGARRAGQPGPTDLAGAHAPPEVPLHPLLPAGESAHHQPHAASAGPSAGARGAAWFAAAMAVIVVACLIGLLVLLATG